MANNINIEVPKNSEISNISVKIPVDFEYNEKERSENEVIRVQNENSRVDAENERQENEKVRQEYIKQLKEQVLSGEVGNGIESYELVEGNHFAGTFDTYRITFTDGSTKDILIYNGRDGNGAGDMVKAIYDVNNDGIVDNAEKVNNHTVNSDVPEDAAFTDTIIETYKYRFSITQDTVLEEEITIPASYKVGANCLDVYFCGERLLKANTSDTEGHYYEVGEAEEISNKIRLTSDWFNDSDSKPRTGDVFEFVIRGSYE